MKKLEKLDLLMIIFAIIACFFALVVMHGWPTGEWALGWTSLAAIGGVAAGAGAFYAAKVAIKVAERQEQRERKRKRIEAEVAASSLAPQLRLIKNQLEFCLQLSKSNTREPSVYSLSSQTALLLQLVKGLDDQDIRLFAYMSQQKACKIAEAKAYISGFHEKSQAIQGKITQDMKASIFYGSANGNQVLEKYCRDFESISKEIFERNWALHASSSSS